MQSPNKENRLLVVITLILATVLTTFYICYTPPSTVNKSADIPSGISSGSLSINKDDLQAEKQMVNHLDLGPNACDKVDISWLAGDRIYWDGWTDKAMFMRKDGTFTKGNVYIQQGEEVCIVVLLGPTPAQSSIKDEDHLGFKDSIVVFATGNFTKMTIDLQPHKTQTNAYFAPVTFTQQDTYRLDAIDEYRSYFWETPILHNYKPFHFHSQNYLVVSPPDSPSGLPACDLAANGEIQGTWVDPSQIRMTDPQLLYATFENSELDYIHSGKVFIPNKCQLEFTSAGQAAKCLDTKTVHAWGDNNLRRNLKAIHYGNKNWCNIESAAKMKDNSEQQMPDCFCNDDAEDSSNLYPWVSDPYVPLELDNSWDTYSRIYYNNQLDTLTFNNKQIYERMKTYVSNDTVPEADLVIVGLGNADIQALKVSPDDFFVSFKQMLLNIRKVYPHQTIIVRTPQYFCCGTLSTWSWNTGRSLTFSDTVRHLVKSFDKMLLWDTHHLGTEETTCRTYGTSYSNRNVINTENLLLYRLICSAP